MKVQYKKFSQSQIPSLVLTPEWNGEYVVEDVNESCLELLGMKKESILQKNLLQEMHFDNNYRKNLSFYLLKTAFDFVKTYRCSKKIEKFYLKMKQPGGELKEFEWEVECHPLEDNNGNFRLLLQIKNLIKSIKEEPGEMEVN